MGQREEIETIRERSISLKLSDADVKRICEKAGGVGITVSGLLENFIGDLVSGTYNNGSDERRLANEWFERCWFGIFPENTFLKYLMDRDSVEDILEYWNEINWFKNLEETEDLSNNDKEFLEELEERMNEKFKEFQGQRKVDEEEVTLDDEMEKVIKWGNEYKQIHGRMMF